MEDQDFNFGPATAIVVKWTAADEDRYADDYDKARELGGIVVDWMEATGEISQRAFVRGMGYDDKKFAGVVTKVRRSFVVATCKPALVEKYERQTAEGDRTLSGLVTFIDMQGVKAPKVKELTPAQRKVVAAKVKAIKAELAGLDKALVKAILADLAK